MPGWLISLLISLVLKLGVPWLLRRFPGLPPGIREILEKLIEDLRQAKADKQELVKKAKQDIKDKCSGVGCPTDLKRD